MSEIKLYNDNCLNVMKEIQNVDAIITDPLYDLDYQTKNNYHRHFQLLSKCIIVFCPPENLWQGKCQQTLFWIKPISTKNTKKSYSRFVEMIQVWNGDTWNNDRHWSQYTNVFTDVVENNKDHPYVKPLSLMIRLILNHTNEGDTVFDPFMGSGTTGQACALTGRNFIGCEINKEYFDKAQFKINGANHENRIIVA